MFKNFFLKAVIFYQKFISPVTPKSCRFWPSCSEYSKMSLEKYGILKGLVLSTKRILKCHPWNPGGVDLP